jgi:hypothetical protein
MRRGLMAGAGPQLFGRELDLAETASTVEVRDGQTFIADGSASAGDFLNRINVIECADLNSALRSAGADRGAKVDGAPYLLLARLGPAPAPLSTDRELIDAVEAWRRVLDAQGRYVMGSSLGGIEAAVTQRLRDARTVAADTPFNAVDGQSVAVEVILAADRRHAIELAAAHPLARRRAIEVRRFLASAGR